VHNRMSGVIPRMLHVRFILSFDYLRSAQSVFRTVYCCPGALAAYRGEVVRRVLPAWEGQRFLGAQCTYGEDRALTNDILASGYDTVYQRAAVVHTVVPETYSKLCRMFLRWDRSYIREEFRYGRIVWSRPLGSRILSFYESTITNLRYPVDHGGVSGIRALLPAERALLGFRVRDPVCLFLVLRAHLDLSVRGAYRSRQGLADALKKNRGALGAPIACPSSCLSVLRAPARSARRGL